MESRGVGNVKGGRAGVNYGTWGQGKTIKCVGGKGATLEPEGPRLISGL